MTGSKNLMVSSAIDYSLSSGCRHVVLPSDIGKLLPKNRLLSEVRLHVAIASVHRDAVGVLCCAANVAVKAAHVPPPLCCH